MKTQLSCTVDTEIMSKVNEYKVNNNLKTTSEAIEQLLAKGLSTPKMNTKEKLNMIGKLLKDTYTEYTELRDNVIKTMQNNPSKDTQGIDSQFEDYHEKI